MKKVLFTLALITGLVCFNVEASASYTIDDNQVEALFSSATQASFSIMNEALEMAPSMAIASASAGSKDALVAILLDFFLGGLGIHRFYLGTETMTGIGYILTCGGIFGLMPLVDLIVLAINFDDISAYVGNPKFFMW